MFCCCNAETGQPVEPVDAVSPTQPNYEEPTPEPVTYEEPAKEEEPPPPAPQMTVMVVGARGLRNADWFAGTGQSDSFCEVSRSGAVLCKTKVIDDSLTPMWREEFSLPMEAVELVFKVWDKDLAGRDYLGQGILPVEDFIAQGCNKWLKMSGTDGADSDIKVKVKLPNQDYPAEMVDNETTVPKGSSPSWGLNLDNQDTNMLLVSSVTSGPFQGILTKYDFVTSVNGVTGSAMLGEFQNKECTQLKIKWVKVNGHTVTIKKTEGKFGLRFPQKPSGHFLVIVAIDDTGLVGAYNRSCANVAEQVSVGDRIIAVNGQKGPAAALLSMFEGGCDKYTIELIRPMSATVNSYWN